MLFPHIKIIPVIYNQIIHERWVLVYLNLSTEEFNKIRREEDYPQLFDLFMRKLPRFGEWMTEQAVTRDMMFEYGLARFIISDVMLWYCVQRDKNYLWDDGTMDFSERKKSGWISEYTTHIPYFLWFKNKVTLSEYRKLRGSFAINSFRCSHYYFMGEVPLRNLGRNEVAHRAFLAGKLFDFVSLDQLTLVNPQNNQPLYIYCSSAINLRITGGIPFVKFRECKLAEIQNDNNGLVLESGTYQELSFSRCKVDLRLSSANMMHMNVECCHLNAVCDFARFDSQCNFSYDRNNKFSWQSESEFYTEVTTLFTGSNDYASAGEYYYKKRKALMIESVFPWKNFRSDKFRMNKKEKNIFNIKTFFKGLADMIGFLCWGFGERPSRTLMISTFVILLSSGVYYFNERSCTHTISESLYFSIVSFTTLGFGDITQNTSFLRLFSALESLSGLVLMGLFLAGYASRTKRY